MEYITTRSFPLFEPEEMESHSWFNMWKRKFFPYEELFEGDVVYWYEAKSKELIYKTEVVYVDSYEYSNKQELVDRYEIDPAGKYFSEGADSGYFVFYKVSVIKKLRITRPANFSFPQFGWVKLDEEVAKKWFGAGATNSYQNITAAGSSIFDQLNELNQKMQGITPQRVEKTLNTIIRKDAPIIKALKAAADFTCQFPDCGHKIKTKKGNYYIEVAHVKPVAGGGLSILGNLIVLCPNHHKEFDYGELSVKESTLNRIRGKLNGQEFDITFPYVK